jgi:hypothetical protein
MPARYKLYLVAQFVGGMRARCDRWFDARRFRFGSAIMLKTREESWACLVPLPLLSMNRAVLPKLMQEHDGEEGPPLAQLRLLPETRSKSLPPDKRIPFPAPPSLPCSPVGGTDVPSEIPLRGREEDERLLGSDSQMEELSWTYEGSRQ